MDDNGGDDEKEEFINIENWAKANKMIINSSKTKEIVFRWPGLRRFINSPLINNFEQVDVVNLLGIFLSNNFVLMHELLMYLKCVVSGSICWKFSVNRICPVDSFTLYFWHWLYLDYAMPCHLGVVSAVVSNLDRLVLFFKRIYRCGFSCELIQLETLTSTADKRLFC